MDVGSTSAAEQYAALCRRASRAVIGLDFDGVLSPIVDDPTQAHIHPEAPDLLVEIGLRVASLAVVTGRPVRQALELGRIEQVGDRLAGHGRQIQVFGQYGNERWTSATGELTSPEPPPGLAALRAELPDLLSRAAADGAFVEDKGLAIGVHTRRLADPQGTFERLIGPLTDAAEAHGLGVEPGRLVIEVRAPGTDKGDAIRELCAAANAEGVLFAGDDLGDVAAFEAVHELRGDGAAGVLVCSGSSEQQALVALADIVVPGPDGVVEFLARFVADVDARRDR